MIIVFLYFCSFLLVDGFASAIWNNKKQSHIAKCVISFLLLISFYAFRGLSVLNDTSHYFEAQQELIQSGDLYSHSFLYYDILNRFEPGFQFFQRFIALYVWKHPYAIILISSLIISFSLVYLAQRHTEHIGLAVFLLLHLGGGMGQFTAIRQSFAVIVFYFIVYLCLHKKHIYAAFLIPVAMLFHKYAFILAIPVILSYYQVSFKKIILSAFVAYIAMYYMQGIIEMLGFGESKYVDEEFDHTPIAVIIEVLQTLLIIYVCWYIRKRYKIEPISNIYVWFLVLSVFCSLFSMSIPIFTRFQLYFKPYIALFYIYYLDRTRYKVRSHINFVVVSLLLIQFLVVLIFRNEWSHMVPYSFFDFSVANPETNFGY